MAEVSFGEWLKRRRRGMGLTQQQLAARINYSTIALKKIEAEERHPSPDVVERLAEIFNIPQSEQTAFLRFARGDWKSAPSIESQDAPWRSPSASPRSNLPASLTSLIGREQELARLGEYLSNSNIRLVTLVGPPGIGKTRLGIEAARAKLSDFPDGVFFVALAPLEDPNLVAPTVIQTLGFVGTGLKPPTEHIKDGIGEKQMLLVLDNLEHIIEGTAPIVSELLVSCPRLKILATSREALHVPGEWLYPVPTLIVPTDSSSIDVEKAPQFSGLNLFAERARAVQSDFALNSDNLTAVADICARLDGLPLAIELIAARIRLMSPQVLLQRLSGQFTLYADGRRAVPSRQKSLHGAIAWSYDLLSDDEQRLFAYLSVFSGGFTLEAAESIFSRTMTTKSISDLIASLLDKSLLQRTFNASAEPRFNMLVTIQQFALECLQHRGEEGEVRNWHLSYFLDLSERAELALRGPAQMEWHARLNDERDNVRTALDWADKTDVEAGLYISGRLHDYWESLDLREGARWLQAFIQKPESKTYPGARARALYTYGDLLCDFQQFVQAHSQMQESLDLYRASNDKAGQVFALLSLSSIVDVMGHREQSIELAEQALELSQSLGDIWRQAWALSKLGRLKPPDPRSRITYWEEVIDMFRKAGAWRSVADHLGDLGMDLVLNGDIETAQKYLDESTSLLQWLNNKVQWTPAKVAYSQIALTRGNYEQARALLQELILTAEELGGQQSYLEMRVRLGYVALREGQLTEARHIFAETVQNFQRDRSEGWVVFTLEGMAGFYVAVGKPQIAAQLIGWADASREQIPDIRPTLEQADVDKIVTECIVKMGEAAFSDAYDQGQRMTLDEAVAFALGDTEANVG